MKTQRIESPPGADPLAPVRALRSLAERFLDSASTEIERWEGMPGPEWLERDLAQCERFIRDASSASGLVLDYEGGRQLAEAKVDRRDLRRMREEAVRPYRRRAELWRSLRTRLGMALKKSRGQGAQPQHLRALLALVDDLAQPLSDHDTQTLKEARACIRQLQVDPDARRPRKIGAYAAPSGTGGDAETAPFSPYVPSDVELDSSLVNRYLPLPSELEVEPEDRGVLERFAQRRYDMPEDYRLNQAALRLSLLSGFEVLLCIPLLRGVEQHCLSD